MTRALMLVAALAVATQQQPVFRSALDVVTVDVSVRSLGTPVGGLTAKDFVLLDNGVPQTIESIEATEVPLDVSVLIDANEDATIGLDHVHQDIQRIARLLRPSDRLRVTMINAGVHDVMRATAPASVPTFEKVELRGLSSAHDGIAAALLRAPGPDRRHLVIAITNGIDALSTLSAPAVAEIAKHSQAVLHIVQTDAIPIVTPEGVTYQSGRQREWAARCGLSGVCGPKRLFWRPFDDNDDVAILKAAAESTGGDIHLPGLFRGDAGRLFEKVFQDYRRSYVLRYTPAGVTREGWHEITVTVPAHSSYTIHARRGYSIDAPPPAATIVTPSAAAWSVASLNTVIGAYNRADYAGTEREFARLPSIETRIREFREGGNPWPANPRREAAFVLELAETAIRTRRTVPRDAALGLLRDFRRLVRHPIEPDAFERYWLWTAIAMLQGWNLPEAAGEFADYGLTRFPDEPRFLLARAVSRDLTRAFVEGGGRAGFAEATFVRDVLSRYDAAARFPETAGEARVRTAYFLHRLGRDAEALAALDASGTLDANTDSLLAYLAPLMRGRVLESLDRFDEARTAYESARQVFPEAQSPRVSLMRLAVRAGDRPAAERLAAEIQRASADAFDPWWIYWMGDFRQYGSILGRLRETTQ